MTTYRLLLFLYRKPKVLWRKVPIPQMTITVPTIFTLAKGLYSPHIISATISGVAIIPLAQTIICYYKSTFEQNIKGTILTNYYTWNPNSKVVGHDGVSFTPYRRCSPFLVSSFSILLFVSPFEFNKWKVVLSWNFSSSRNTIKQ